MRYALTDAPLHFGTFLPSARDNYITLRVVSGTVLLNSDQAALINGDGLSVGTSDGVVQIRWPYGGFWIRGSGSASVEVLLP